MNDTDTHAKCSNSALDLDYLTDRPYRLGFSSDTSLLSSILFTACFVKRHDRKACVRDGGGKLEHKSLRIGCLIQVKNMFD